MYHVVTRRLGCLNEWAMLQFVMLDGFGVKLVFSEVLRLAFARRVLGRRLGCLAFVSSIWVADVLHENVVATLLALLDGLLTDCVEGLRVGCAADFFSYLV